LIPILPEGALERRSRVNIPRSKFRRPPVASRSSSRYDKMCQTLTLLIPCFYNPDHSGHRKEVEQSKIQLTENEIQQLFGGYTLLRCVGWDGVTRVKDSHLRFEMDLSPQTARARKLREWKQILERRFRQSRIYMKISRAPARWL
jgi:hypothetical protein